MTKENKLDQFLFLPVENKVKVNRSLLFFVEMSHLVNKQNVKSREILN